MTESSSSFGSQVYDELRRRTGFTVIAGQLDYAAIQELKSADREATAKLLEARSAISAERFMAAEPAEVAQILIQEAKDAQQRANRGMMTADFIQFLTSILGYFG
jgi:hypothetical protein